MKGILYLLVVAALPFGGALAETAPQPSHAEGSR